jgi:tRNA (mo5U34)-methyltransferase
MATAAQTSTSRPRGLAAAVASNRLWYHTLELAPGLVTPGWFDLRPIVDRLPWPDVSGKRCLDIGTYDGYWAFEMERRGAAEVVATDIDDHDRWDWPPDVRASGPERLALLAGPGKGRGFRIAKQALGSAVDRVGVSVYDLSPERIGTFDVVVCGTLLLHLREPLRALEAVRGVCRGAFLSAEQIDLPLTVLHPRRPLAQLNGSGEKLQWWVPNAAAHRRMVFAAGFAIERQSRPYCIPLGTGHRDYRARAMRSVLRDAFRRALTGGTGIPHAAVLAGPRV